MPDPKKPGDADMVGAEIRDVQDRLEDSRKKLERFTPPASAGARPAKPPDEPPLKKESLTPEEIAQRVAELREARLTRQATPDAKKKLPRPSKK